MSTINLESVFELPVAERIRIVEEIWDSIEEDTSFSVQLSPEQRVELHRRLAAHRENPSSSIPWQEVRESLFRGQS